MDNALQSPEFGVQEALSFLTEKIPGVEGLRFRPVDWKGKAVVYVPGWAAKLDTSDVDPELFRRVFFDPKEPDRIDCLVGLVARVAFYNQEKQSVNPSNLRLISKGITKEIKKPRSVFENAGDEIPYKQFFSRLCEEAKTLASLKKQWIRYSKQVKKMSKDFSKPDDFFTAVLNHDAPWKKSVRKNTQWKQFIEANPEKNNFVNRVDDATSHYTKLCDQWEKYIDSIQNPSYEISVPVIAGNKLLGILSVHNKNNFTTEEARLCSQYASLLAIFCLRSKVTLLQNLQRLAADMTGESNLAKISSDISQGIRAALFGLSVEEVFPILYTCSGPIGAYDDLMDFEKIWKGLFKYQARDKPRITKEKGLWDIENLLGELFVREDGLGHTSIRCWKDAVAKETATQAKNYFQVSPDVDNPDSSTGSRTASELGIKTTGCLPLIYGKRVYGLLYLHCKKRYFFTEAELEALEAFAIQAAIAIKNNPKIGGPIYTYEDLYGKELLNTLIGKTK